jgi:hypothetical protein
MTRFNVVPMILCMLLVAQAIPTGVKAGEWNRVSKST